MRYGRAHTTTSKTWLKRARPTIGSMATRAIESCWLCWTMHGINWNMCGHGWQCVDYVCDLSCGFESIWVTCALKVVECRWLLCDSLLGFLLEMWSTTWAHRMSESLPVENQYLPLLRQPVYHIACDLLRLAVTCTVSHKPKMQSNALGEPVDQWSCCTSSMHGSSTL